MIAKVVIPALVFILILLGFVTLRVLFQPAISPAPESSGVTVILLSPTLEP